MEKIKVNDMGLQGRFIIDRDRIWDFFPNQIIAESKDLSLKINKGQPVWVMTLRSGEKWYYVPYSHEICKAENIRFGRIFFGRFARYQRDEYEHKSCLKKVYPTYFCTSKTMFLVKETKEYWPQNLPKDMKDLEGGFCQKTKWFDAFPSSPEAEEFNKNKPY
ncbi:MAG: hypothetical protein IJ545_07225 [Alphaproteobacteria bacterium]|nr:hypothetical protein [Alphaproteobacteria bacterium]